MVVHRKSVNGTYVITDFFGKETLLNSCKEVQFLSSTRESRGSWWRDSNYKLLSQRGSPLCIRLIYCNEEMIPLR